MSTHIASWTIKGAITALIRKAVRRGVDRDTLANLLVTAANALRTTTRADNQPQH